MLTRIFCQSLILGISGLLLCQATVINYYFDGDSDERVNDCINNAIDQLMDETCLTFQQNPTAPGSILFLDSGHCSWQEANKTVHLGVDCINDAMCSQIIARALTNDRPYPLVSRTLNLKYNCSDKCTIFCENGGNVTGDCTCDCSYGFSGERCESLKSEAQYTDTSCGYREAEEEGTIALSTFPSNAPKVTFCQWLIKAEESWQKIEFEILELDLDHDDLMPGQKCGDTFAIFGASSVKNPIPCDNQVNSVLGQKYRTDANWVLIELRSNAYATKQHKGPLIKYNVVREHGPNDIRTFSSEQVSISASTAASFSTLIMTAILRSLAH